MNINLMDLGFYIFPAMAGIICILVLVWYRNPFNSIKLRWTATRCMVRLLENYGSNFLVIDAFLVPLSKDIFDRNNKSYILDLQRAIFDEHGRGYLYYDVDSALPLATERQLTLRVNELVASDMMEPDEVVIKSTPGGLPVITVRKDEKGKPLLWFDPSYVDAKLFNVKYKAAVWGQVLSGVFQKYALYIIIGLIVGIVAVIIVSFWQINQLTKQIADLAKTIAEMAVDGSGGDIVGG